jgi:hypothetical protein
MMSEIYQRSSLTIAALGAQGNDEGCFALRDPLALQPCWLFDDSKRNPAMDKYLYYNGTVDNMPLKSRAWVLQEELLSSRTLYFGNVVYWHCREMTASELDPNSDPGQNKRMTAARSQFSSKNNDTIQDSLAISSPHERENSFLDHQAQTFLNHWCRIVENYTARHLTFKSDRPHAISGLLRCLQERRGIENLAGLLSPFLLQQLTWIANHDEWRPNPQKLPSWEDREKSWAKFPSWSWLGIDNRIDYKLDIWISAPRKPWEWLVEV